MATPDWVVPAITGGTAIVAAVSAQVVGGILNSKSEAAKLDWEREQAAIARFSTEKRQAFVRFLAEHEQFADAIKRYLEATGKAVWVEGAPNVILERQLETANADLSARFLELDRSRRESEHEVLLLAPEVIDDCEELHRKAERAFDRARAPGLGYNDRCIPLWEYTSQIKRCRESFSKTLGVVPDDE